MLSFDQKWANLRSSACYTELGDLANKTGVIVWVTYDGKWVTFTVNYKKVYIKIMHRKHDYIMEKCVDIDILPNSMYKMINSYI